MLIRDEITTALDTVSTDLVPAELGRLRGDIDPALLTIARDHFAGDERVTFVEAHLTDPTWTERQERQRRQGALDWADWWGEVAVDPLLTEPAARRFALLGDPRQSRLAGADRDRPTTTRRNLDTLLEQGFGEARQVWCSASDALVAALR